jgi:integral membrane sensor domain MASE1
MAVAFLRIILYFGLLLLVMSLIALALVPRDAPGFVAAVLAVGANTITVSVAALILRWLLAKDAQQEKQAAERWETLQEHLKQDDE